VETRQTRACGDGEIEDQNRLIIELRAQRYCEDAGFDMFVLQRGEMGGWCSGSVEDAFDDGYD
jgi:hypothetical protein